MRSTIIFAKPNHLEDILRIWGPNRQTLGLMPKDAFKESIKKKWILVLQLEDEVIAYLQFRFTNRTQTLSIVHLCVEKIHRGNGFSELLVNKLVEEFRFQSRGIKLNCRNDYKIAEIFWNRYGFQPKSKQPSRGNNPNIELVTWWYNFGTQDLFSANQNDKINVVLDFNIIAKMMEPEKVDDSKEQITELLSDWLVTEVDYFYASETINELFRDRNKARQERSRQFIKIFKELNIDKPSVRVIESELEDIYTGKTDNDISDRRQLAEAIQSGFPYFITFDAGILRHKREMLEKYHLNIVKPFQLRSEIDFTINTFDYYPSQLSANNFTVSKLRPTERDDLDTIFLATGTGEKKSMFNSTIDEIIARPDGGVLLIKEGNVNVGIVTYHESANYVRVPIIRTIKYSLRKTIFMQNINDLLKLALEHGKDFLAITDDHINLDEKNILHNYGFFEVDQKWIKGIKKGILTLEKISNELSTFSAEIPKLKDYIGGLGSNKQSGFYLDMFTLEKILWPLKISDAAIPCFIIPIKPHYARELFDTKAAKAELFGVQPKLIWSKENVYYRNIKPNVEKFPARILWYASDSKFNTRSKAIVCSSYLNEVIIGPAKEMFKKHERFGIYSWKKDILPLAKNIVDQPIKILRFSDSEAFDKPISLSIIKDIFSQNQETFNNFQSPKAIKNTTFMELYALGKGITH